MPRLNRNSFVARVNEFLLHLHNTKAITGSSSVQYSITFKQFAKFIGGREINPDSFDKFLIHERDRGIKDKRLLDHKRLLNQFFNWCIERRYTNVNPVTDSRIKLRMPKPKVETYTRDEYEAIKQAAIGTPFYFDVVLAYGTGMRVSDVVRMRWSNFDVEKELITYIPHKVRKWKTRVTVPIIPNSDLADMIFELEPMRPEEDDWMRPELSVSFEGAATAVENWMRQTLNKLGIKGKTFHTFRRTFVSNVISSGVDSWIAMKMVGITNLKTMKHYTVPHPDSLRDAMVKAMQFAERT